MTTLGPNKSWRLIHDGESVISLAELSGYTETIHHAYEANSLVECFAEAERLGLIIADEFLGLTDPDVELESVFVKKLEQYYDEVAQSHRYDNRLTCALRAGYPGPFKQEGEVFAIWMDTCNAYAYSQMESVKVGQREMPTPEQLISELPEISW